MMKEGTQASRELIREFNMQPQNGNVVGWSLTFPWRIQRLNPEEEPGGIQLRDTWPRLLLLSCSALKISENFPCKKVQGLELCWVSRRVKGFLQWKTGSGLRIPRDCWKHLRRSHRKSNVPATAWHQEVSDIRIWGIHQSTPYESHKSAICPPRSQSQLTALRIPLRTFLSPFLSFLPCAPVTGGLDIRSGNIRPRAGGGGEAIHILFPKTGSPPEYCAGWKRREDLI